MKNGLLLIFALACYTALASTLIDFNVAEKTLASTNDLVVH